MKALLIDAIAHTITEVQVPEVDEGADGITDHLKCNLFDVVPFAPGEDLFVDDEGLLAYPNPNGYFTVGGALFAGRGLLLGVTRDGYSKSTTWTVNRLSTVVQWQDTPPQELCEPRFEVIPLDDDSCVDGGCRYGK